MEQTHGERASVVPQRPHELETVLGILFFFYMEQAAQARETYEKIPTSMEKINRPRKVQIDHASIPDHQCVDISISSNRKRNYYHGPGAP